MKQKLYISFLFLFLPLFLQAQLFLQIEKQGSAKTQKLSIGTYLEYRLYEYEEWQQGYIENLIPEENIVVLNDRYVKLEDIRTFRFDTPQRWSQPIGRNLYLFSAAWLLYSGAAAIFDPSDPFSTGDVIVAGSAAATGFLLRRIFRFKKYRFDKRNQLRILDLRVSDDLMGQSRP